MNPLTQSNLFFSSLFEDPEVTAVFETGRTFARFLAFEIALSEALAASGAVDVSTAKAAIKKMHSFSPDMNAIKVASPIDGVPVPEFLRQLRKHVGADLTPAVHVGSTSQDLIDTATVLALKEVNDTFTARLETAIAGIERLIESQGNNSLMGRTRMQAALPITVRHRLENWVIPLYRHRDSLAGMRSDLQVLQFGGATGDRSANRDKVVEIGADLANRLGLTDPGYAWHNDRTRFVAYAGWLSLVTGSLGKIGQDICLMAQQGIEEITQSGGGTSSAMAHKQNPVKAEMLIALAQYNAGQLALMHNALIHEQERSGSAWTLEWMVLPAMVCTTGRALQIAVSQLDEISRVGS
ncbi:3-carboxy-cis,cis-muconate cycloisomerase [Cognatishimia sp. WU-CL00825]|uniref:3-carboxy-cis,cis-muconate cycloisomerase n=1 Tax=Cognatishimia sp. WU-CL00825 TaxID=3127658 RepID=UPI00310AE676